MVRKNLSQEVLPVVLILKIMKEAHTVDTKFMLEGDNLIHDKGKEFILFLQQAINAMRDEDKEDDLEESKEGEVEGFTDLG